MFKLWELTSELWLIASDDKFIPNLQEVFYWEENGQKHIVKTLLWAWLSWWSFMTNFPWVWILWNICWYWETAICLRWKEEKDAGWHVLTREMLCQKNAIQINQNHFAVSSCLSVANNNNINSHGHSQPQLQGMGRHRRLRGLFGLENDWNIQEINSFKTFGVNHISVKTVSALSAVTCADLTLHFMIKNYHFGY